MLKTSMFARRNELGYTAIPIFGTHESTREFEKNASYQLVSPVATYIAGLRPKQGAQYVLVNALGAGEYFGCFPAGTLVETDQGEVSIELIQPGALVRTHRNRFREVRAVVPRQSARLCDLYAQGLPSNLPSLTATPNHELWVVTREDFIQTKRRVIWKGDVNASVEQRREQALRELEFSWLPIEDLQTGDYIAEPFPINEDPAALGDERWNCPEVAFLMGLYAAEGCVAYRYDRDNDAAQRLVYVTSCAEVETHAELIRCAAVLGHKVSPHSDPRTNSTRLGLCSTELAALCLRHIGTPAVHKKLSCALLRMPRVWQRVFFDAYAAGDGCVRGTGRGAGTIRCVSASAALMRSVRLLLARLGLAASISGRHNKKASWYNGNAIFELIVSGGQLHDHGRAKSYLHPAGYILSAVKKIKQYAWDGEVYDLTVEEDASFVASGIAVHNSNINGDHFPEAGLIHRPQGWTDNPLVDRVLAKDWPYGFPSFYSAHAFAHHRNKDASRAYGEVELAVWNDLMKRVELVVRVDYDKCLEFGGTSVWDKLQAGQFPDVSMGSRVPFDTSAITLDGEAYNKAKATYDPKKHRSPGQAILEVHKKTPIKGLAITREDYDEFCLTQMNRILPDGRKVFVYNDYPRFFDISFVFIGADRTAKVMVYIARNGSVEEPRAKTAAAYPIDTFEKVAGVVAEKDAELKAAEIEKEVLSIPTAAKALPLMTRNEPSIPDDVLHTMATVPLASALSTVSGLGIVLRPQEFQRIILVGSGNAPLADALDDKNLTFPRVDESSSCGMSSDAFLPALARLLLPLFDQRTALAPAVERRVAILGSNATIDKELPSSHSSELLRKIGAAYNGYREQVLEMAPYSQSLIQKTATTQDVDLVKVATADPADVFTALSYRYLRDAFMNELPAATTHRMLQPTD